MPCVARLVCCLVAASLSLLASACSTLTGRPPAPQRAIDVPAAVAATLLSAALRQELRAEPVAPASGAPVTVNDDGSYDVRFVCDAAGHWLPEARHRLSIGPAAWDGAVTVAVRRLDADQQLHGFGCLTRARIDLHIAPVGAPAAAPSGASSTITFDLPARKRAQLMPLLDRTLRLATDVTRGGPGLQESNLAAWRSSQLVQRCQNMFRTAPEQAGDLLRRAARLRGAPSAVHAHLAAVVADQGDLEAAASSFRRALLTTRDPVARARLAARAAAAARGAARPTSVRTDALDHLLAGDLQTAERLMHSARRAQPAPSVDYRLLGRLHRQRGDDMATLAAELLAREHDPRTRAMTPASRQMSWAQRMVDWQRQLSGIDPWGASGVRPPSPVK